MSKELISLEEDEKRTLQFAKVMAVVWFSLAFALIVCELFI